MNKNRISYLTENFGITPGEFEMLRLDGCSDTSVYFLLLQLRGHVSEEAALYRLIGEECGKTESDVNNELSFIRSMDPPIEISLERYFRFSGYTLNVLNEKESLEMWLDKLRRYIFLRDDIIQKIETEMVPFSDFEKELEEVRGLISEMLSSGRKSQLIDAIKDIRPDLLENAAAFNEVAVDMELSVDVLGFVTEEYVSYHFWERSVPERLEYVSDRLRKRIGLLLNSEEGREILNNKALTYQALKPLYGRKIRQMDAEGGYPAFEKAFREKPVLVKKNNFQSLGKEVEKIEVTEDTDLPALYERLSQNGAFFILEDLIIPHPELNRLNPDSLNTIRVVTLMEQGRPIILDTFIRTGRKGSFVDNGGSGGIFVHIDHTKGITDSHGIDERGFHYESHPDHGYRFTGIRMPHWEEAVNTAKKAALMIPEAGYVGWDVVCTNDNRWIIVEGNAMTMYIGQQATIDVGKRKAVLESINYEKLTGSEQ